MLAKMHFRKKCEDLGVFPCMYNASECITALHVDDVIMLVLKQ